MLSSTQIAELKTLDEAERDHIVMVLAAVNGNRTQAAKILDITVRTLQRNLKRWKLQDRFPCGCARNFYTNKGIL